MYRIPIEPGAFDTTDKTYFRIKIIANLIGISKYCFIKDVLET